MVAIRQVRDARAVAAKPAMGVRDVGGREWRVGRFPSPTRRLYWLDRPQLDSAGRRALVRAFNESALYGDDARSARHERAPGPGQAPRAAWVVYVHPGSGRRAPSRP
jgi:hypothetical protein